MTNEEILLPYFKKLKKLKDNNEFIIDKTGVKIVEIINCNIKGLNPQQWYLEFNGRKSPVKYIKKEIEWYNSMSLNIKGYVDDVEIWKKVSSKDGFINSNYGWCIYSKDNYKQYDNSLLELIKNQDSRRACMIYNRPSMWEDYKKDGMNEFICTFSTQQFIRNNKLIYIIYQRSADAIFGALFVDFAWHCEVYIKLYNNLKKHYNNLEIGQIDFNCGSLHIYERHFEMLDKICETKI